jgi:hypothetical protein
MKKNDVHHSFTEKLLQIVIDHENSSLNLDKNLNHPYKYKCIIRHKSSRFSNQSIINVNLSLPMSLSCCIITSTKHTASAKVFALIHGCSFKDLKLY